MVGMFFADVFDAKVIDNESEAYWSGNVFPEAWGVDDFVVAVLCKALLEQLVG